MKAIVCLLVAVALALAVRADEENAIWSDCSGGKGHVKNIQVQLTPEVPKPGKDLHIVASADLDMDVTTGAKASFYVKWEGMKLISETVDLCAQVTCPIAKGPYKIDKVVNVPDIAPGGHYEGHVEAKAANGELIACINLDFRM